MRRGAPRRRPARRHPPVLPASLQPWTVPARRCRLSREKTGGDRCGIPSTARVSSGRAGRMPEGVVNSLDLQPYFLYIPALRASHCEVRIASWEATRLIANRGWDHMVRNGSTKRRRGDIWAQLGVSACVLLIPPLVMAAGVMVFGSAPPGAEPRGAVEQAAVAPQPTVAGGKSMAGGKSIAMAERPDGGASFALASADQHPVISEPLPMAEPHPVAEPAAASHPVNEPRTVTRQRQAAEQREARQRQLAEQRTATKQRQANERAAAELRATAEQRAGTEPSAALEQHAVAEQRPVTEPPAAARQRLEQRPAIEQHPTTEQRPAAGRRPASDQQAIAEPRPDAQQRPVTEPRPVAEPSQATVPAVHQLPPTEQRVAAVQSPSSVGGQSALKDPARYSGSAPTTASERLPSADEPIEITARRRSPWSMSARPAGHRESPMPRRRLRPGRPPTRRSRCRNSRRPQRACAPAAGWDGASAERISCEAARAFAGRYFVFAAVRPLAWRLKRHRFGANGTALGSLRLERDPGILCDHVAARCSRTKQGCDPGPWSRPDAPTSFRHAC